MAAKVQGLDRLLRQMGALPALQLSAVRDALEAGAVDMRDAIRRAAQGGGPVLVKSVNYLQGQAVKMNGQLGTGSGGASGSLKASQGLLFSVVAGGDEAFFARWYEFGTAPHNISKGANSKTGKVTGGGWHPGARPHPFFYPTVRARKKLLKGRVTRASNKAAKAVAAVR